MPKQQVAGDTLVKFTIQRDGRSTNVELEKSSGYFALDLTAQRALLVTRQLPPLPAQFTETTADGPPHFPIRALMTRRHLFLADPPCGRCQSRRCWRPDTRRRNRRPAAAAAAERNAARSITATRARRRSTPCRISSRCQAMPRRVRPPRPSAQVLWDDLGLRARVLHDPARHVRVDSRGRDRSTDVPFDRWRELGADGLVDRHGAEGQRSGLKIQVRLFNVESASRRCSRASTRARPAIRACMRTRSPTKFISSSARCRASRARS